MSFARVHLGMTRDEFLDTTPRYFDQLCQHHLRKRRMDEGMLAQLTAVVFNTSYRAPDERVSGQQFYITKDVDAKPAPKLKRRTKAQIADETRAVFLSLMQMQ